MFVCVYLCSIWSHSGVILSISYMHGCKKEVSNPHFNLRKRLSDSSWLKNLLLCLMMSSRCNNVQISCCCFLFFFFFVASRHYQQYWGPKSRDTGAQLQYWTETSRWICNVVKNWDCVCAATQNSSLNQAVVFNTSVTFKLTAAERGLV